MVRKKTSRKTKTRANPRSGRAVIKKTRKKSRSTKKVTVRKTPARRFNPMDDMDIAMDFASKIHKKFDAMIKASILFGSQAKHETSQDSDIDIIIIIDDASISWDLELIAWYREELARLIAAQEYSTRLHINTLKLTTWWNDLMHGDPVILNILRYGQTLVDIGGFFKPLKSLLLQGKIHSTPEAVHAALQRAPTHLARSKMAELGAIEGVYWTMVDSAQAALITLGKLPPSPEHITEMIKQYFTDTGMMKAEYVKWYREIFSLHKEIAHGRKREVKGAEIDLWQFRAEKFMMQMTSIIDKLIEARKK